MSVKNIISTNIYLTPPNTPPKLSESKASEFTTPIQNFDNIHQVATAAFTPPKRKADQLTSDEEVKISAEFISRSPLGKDKNKALVVIFEALTAYKIQKTSNNKENTDGTPVKNLFARDNISPPRAQNQNRFTNLNDDFLVTPDQSSFTNNYGASKNDKTPPTPNPKAAKKSNYFRNLLISNKYAAGCFLGEGDQVYVFEFGENQVIKVPKHPSSDPQAEFCKKLSSDESLPIAVEPIEVKKMGDRYITIQNKGRPFNVSHDMEDEKVMTQIQQMIAYCYQNNLAIDLKPANLAWFGNELKLIDVCVYKGHTIKMILDQDILKEFARGDQEIYNRLKPEDFDPESTEMSIEDPHQF